MGFLGFYENPQKGDNEPNVQWTFAELPPMGTVEQCDPWEHCGAS